MFLCQKMLAPRLEHSGCLRRFMCGSVGLLTSHGRYQAFKWYRVISWTYWTESRMESRMESRIKSQKQNMLLHTRMHHTFQSKHSITNLDINLALMKFKWLTWWISCTSLHPDRNKGHLHSTCDEKVKAQIKKDGMLQCDTTDSSVTNKVPRT